MEVWITTYTSRVCAMYDTYNEAVIRAGDWWSIQYGRHWPVTVHYYKRTVYDNLERNRSAFRYKQPWAECAGVLVWRNGRPT